MAVGRRPFFLNVRPFRKRHCPNLTQQFVGDEQAAGIGGQSARPSQSREKRGDAVTLAGENSSLLCSFCSEEQRALRAEGQAARRKATGINYLGNLAGSGDLINAGAIVDRASRPFARESMWNERARRPFH